MSFGLKNAPPPSSVLLTSSFRSSVASLSYLPLKMSFVFTTVTEHITHLHTLPTLLQDAGISLKLESASPSNHGSITSVRSLNPVVSPSPERPRWYSKLSSFLKPSLNCALSWEPATTTSALEGFLKDRSTTHGPNTEKGFTGLCKHDIGPTQGVYRSQAAVRSLPNLSHSETRSTGHAGL